jgi:hypothetical protein
MFSRAGVEPTARPSNLSAKLNQWHIKWSEHQRPFFFKKQGLCRCDVFSVPVVRGDRNRFLFPRNVFKLFSECLEHERFHHRSTITQHVPTKRVDHLITMGPSDCTMNRGFRNAIAPVINQRFPRHFTPSWNALDLLAQWAIRIHCTARSAGFNCGWSVMFNRQYFHLTCSIVLPQGVQLVPCTLPCLGRHGLNRD